MNPWATPSHVKTTLAPGFPWPYTPAVKPMTRFERRNEVKRQVRARKVKPPNVFKVRTARALELLQSGVWNTRTLSDATGMAYNTAYDLLRKLNEEGQLDSDMDKRKHKHEKRPVEYWWKGTV